MSQSISRASTAGRLEDWTALKGALKRTVEHHRAKGGPAQTSKLRQALLRGCTVATLTQPLQFHIALGWPCYLRVLRSRLSLTSAFLADLRQP